MTKPGATNGNVKQLPARLPAIDWRLTLQAATGKSLKQLCSESHPEPASSVVRILFDGSGSMADSESKLRQAQKGSLDFAKSALRKGHTVGIIRFADDAHEMLRPSRQEDEISEAIARIVATGGTNLTAALMMGTDRFRDTDGYKLMCVITDGVPDDRAAALRAADEAKRAGITICVVGTDDADAAFLKKLASTDASAEKVESHELAGAINSMARMLPGPKA